MPLSYAARRAYFSGAGLLAVLLPLLTFAAAAPAETLPIGPDLEAAGWRELGVSGKPGNRFVGHPDGVIEVASSSSVSRLYRPIDADLAVTPVLTWRWRVDEPVPPTDLTRKGEDDTAITLYIGFPWDPGRASFTERLTRPLVEAYAGEDAPGRVLAYVFGGAHERGEVVASPHLGSGGFMRVLRPAHRPTGEWFEERVDLVADYREAFGENPPNPLQIAISADTDDTRSSSRGFVADLAFVGPDAVAPPRVLPREQPPTGRGTSFVVQPEPLLRPIQDRFDDVGREAGRREQPAEASVTPSCSAKSVIDFARPRLDASPLSVPLAFAPGPDFGGLPRSQHRWDLRSVCIMKRE